MNAFLGKVNSIIKKFEDYKIDPLILGLYVVCVILVRDLLENISNFSYHSIEPGILLLVEYPLWYLTIILFFVIIAYIFTKENITKIMKFFSFLLPIIWLAPLIDLFLTKGAVMGFVNIRSWSELPFKAILWLQHSPIHLPGITWGLMIELTLILIGLSFYVYAKTKSILKAIFSFIAFYLVTFLMGAPSLATLLLATVNKSWISLTAFTYNFNPEVVVSLALFFILTISLVIFFCIYDRKKCINFFKYLSITRVIHYVLILNLGTAFAVISHLKEIHMSFLTIFILILANLVVVFSWIFAKNVNDYFDKKEDSLSNKGNPFISKQFTRSELIVIYGMVLLMSLGISYLIGYAFFFFNILTLSVSFLYSCPPMRLKRILFFSHLCIGLASGIVLLQGFSLVGNIMPLNNLNLKLFLWITLAFFLGSHLKDIKDYKGDKNAGIKTLPTVFGERNAKIMITLILSILFLFSVILFGLIYLVPFAILCALGASYFLNRKNYKEVYVFLIYFSFFVVVAIFLLRSLISQIV